MIKLSECKVSRAHRPVPSRYIDHHIQPQVCGGKTTPDNIVRLCDNCHYTVHALMYRLRMTAAGHTFPTEIVSNRRQKAIALEGWIRCTIAGTTDKIPNEG